jgi:hypothetical protein
MSMRIYAKKVDADGYKFDSEMEYQYYLELKQRLEDKTIVNLKIHPLFELQPKFNKNGKEWRPLHYEGDFQFEDLLTSKTRVVDVKGMILPEFEIHRKLFEFKYPQFNLEVLKYSKTTGWVSIDDYKKTMRTKRQQIRQERTAFKNKLERLSFLNQKIVILKGETNLTPSQKKKLDAYEKELQEIIRS